LLGNFIVNLAPLSIFLTSILPCILSTITLFTISSPIPVPISSDLVVKYESKILSIISSFIPPALSSISM